MPNSAAPPKGDVVPLLVVLGIAGLVAVLVAITLLDRALAAGDGSAWAMFAIVCSRCCCSGRSFARSGRTSTSSAAVALTLRRCSLMGVGLTLQNARRRHTRTRRGRPSTPASARRRHRTVGMPSSLPSGRASPCSTRLPLLARSCTTVSLTTETVERPLPNRERDQSVSKVVRETFMFHIRAGLVPEPAVAEIPTGGRAVREDLGFMDVEAPWWGGRRIRPCRRREGSRHVLVVPHDQAHRSLRRHHRRGEHDEDPRMHPSAKTRRLNSPD